MSFESGIGKFADTRLDAVAERVAQRTGLPTATNILTKYFNTGVENAWRKGGSILLEEGKKLSTQERAAIALKEGQSGSSEMVDFLNDQEG